MITPEKLYKLSNFILKSRIHLLKSFTTHRRNVYIKREDELSFGISGTKYRKYASLVLFLEKNAIELVGVIGGAHSNNVLGLCQILRERGIAIKLFLRGEEREELRGNLLLTHLFIDKEDITWIPRADWSSVYQLAELQLKESEKKCFVIPEGANCLPAFIGAQTLADDLYDFIFHKKMYFDHIFLDAGTGLYASAFICRYAELGLDSQIHIVLLAENQESFISQFNKLKVSCRLTNTTHLLDKVCFYSPITAPSYGAVNSRIFHWIKHFAKTEGILTDPVYSAKSLMTFECILESQALEGNILLIHSGGGLGLTGYLDAIKMIV